MAAPVDVVLQRILDAQPGNKGIRVPKTGVEHHNGRKTHCPQGHPYSVENTYYTTIGGRRCRTCAQLGTARWKAARRALPSTEPRSRKLVANETLVSLRMKANKKKTHCIHGHAFTPENTYVDPDGRRNCRACKRERRRKDP
jgi:hypothetical protein